MNNALLARKTNGCVLSTSLAFRFRIPRDAPSLAPDVFSEYIYAEHYLSVTREMIFYFVAAAVCTSAVGYLFLGNVTLTCILSSVVSNFCACGGFMTKVSVEISIC